MPKKTKTKKRPSNEHHWAYGVIRRGSTHGVYRIHFEKSNGKTKIVAWSEKPVYGSTATPGELETELSMMLEDVQKCALNKCVFVEDGDKLKPAKAVYV